MHTLLLSGNFDEDLNDLISALNHLPEDFDIIEFIKVNPTVFSEHQDAKNKACTISMQELLDKIWFENQILAKKGFAQMTFSQKVDEIEKVKKILFAKNTALGKAKEQESEKKGFSLKSISYFLKKNQPTGFEKTVAAGGATKMAANQLNKFLGKENNQDTDNSDDFWDPIQDDLKLDLFNKLKTNAKKDTE